jgi:transposase
MMQAPDFGNLHDPANLRPLERLARVAELALPPALAPVIAPLLDLLGPINHQLEVLDKELGQIVAANEAARHLTTVPGVGR